MLISADQKSSTRLKYTEYKMRKNIIVIVMIVLVIFPAVLIACTRSPATSQSSSSTTTPDTTTPSVSPNPAGEIEATEFMGTQLTPIDKQLNNGLRGTLNIDRATYRLVVDGLVS